VSDVLETPRGFAIVKVEEKLPPGTQPLADVRGDVERAVRDAGAEQAARDAVEHDLEEARAGKTLEELAAGRGLRAVSAPPASRSQPLPDVATPALLATALGLEAGAVDEIVGAEPPYYLFKVAEKTPSDVKPLAAVHDQIVDALRATKARAAARAAADEVLAAAKTAAKGVDGLTAAAQQRGFTVDATGPFTRTQAIPKLGDAPIKEELFALAADAPFATVHELPDAAVVLALKTRVPAEAASADALASLRDGATSRKRSAALEAYRDMLRQRADITVNPDIVTGTRT